LLHLCGVQLLGDLHKCESLQIQAGIFSKQILNNSFAHIPTLTTTPKSASWKAKKYSKILDDLHEIIPSVGSVFQLWKNFHVTPAGGLWPAPRLTQHDM